MLVAKAAGATLTRFAVLGQERAGTNLVSLALDSLPTAACLAKLLDRTDRGVRWYAIDRFDLSCDRDEPDFWDGWNTMDCSIDQFLTSCVFTSYREGLTAAGFRSTYDQIEAFDLVSSLATLGKLQIVHVVRNPIECWVSKKIAERTNRWSTEERRQPACFATVQADPDELIVYCREHLAMERKIDLVFRHSVVRVDYDQLKSDFDAALRGVMRSLGLRGRVRPQTLKLRHDLPMRRRISGFDSLVSCVPSDVRQLLLAAN